MTDSLGNGNGSLGIASGLAFSTLDFTPKPEQTPWCADYLILKKMEDTSEYDTGDSVWSLSPPISKTGKGQRWSAAEATQVGDAWELLEPVAFEDVAVHFTQEEWGSSMQTKDLYIEKS
ncbi:hypothetical protein JRQ81_012317 [Phrynocephalus forsythii]|uniref:KRAB domain-containing protein n=1 Tax=Phrynocephalus forsythii TaxID=171643 RepID=A0A9Q0X7M4_9SAUR|nr:hypothetical protein JRQ81_012317 [Phrynocephalus forsythii]